MQPLSVLTLLIILGGWSFPAATSLESSTAEIQVNLENCAGMDSISLFQFTGMTFQRIDAAPIVENKANLKVELTTTGFYYLGFAANNLKPMILDGGQVVKLRGNCSGMRSAQFEESALNVTYEQLKKTINQNKQQASQMTRAYGQARFDSVRQAQIVLQMQSLDQQQMELIETMAQKHAFLGKIVRLNTYLSYPNNGQAYENEIAYFANEYFKFVSWGDTDYSQMPWVFEAWKSYVQTLMQVGLTNESQKDIVTAALKPLEENPGAHKLAISGALAAFGAKNNPNYLPFGKQFMELYGAEEPLATKSVQSQMDRLAAFATGAEAPNIVMNTPAGEPMELTSLRGKVVLIDFWASWCGPCRRENPNVVKMYNKYHEKGFDIFGVSLDKDQARWEKAIAADGLTWHHVSDLKGWSNTAAQAYGVRSIPHTVLLDAEGRIIARNLRGAQLEQKLAELFGE
ncbi:MAG: TlpA disulfide reductase family protein [Bacteroidota bacterium]